MKKSTLAQLTNRENQLVLTYAPAGLGHLRITDALYDGLPKTVNPVVLGSLDKSIQTLHRITSIHPVGRAVFEWLQSGPLAGLANELYRASLRWDTGQVYQEMARLIDDRLDPLKKILVVSTHFGLAHKLAAVKKKLEKDKGVRIVLVVFVSDDTFQHIWYVDGADLLVVASEYTKRKYAAYGKRLGRKVRIEVSPYPLNPKWGKPLGAGGVREKTNQLNPKSKEPIHLSIPVSGAAVGTFFSSQLIAALREKSSRFRFHIVSKDAPFTRIFLSQMEGKSWVDLHVGKKDREVVDQYDHLLDKHVISLEVTKPSEQAFKAILGTQSRGGVIMLFSRPVGQQEFDNLDFLGRHALIPSKATNAQLQDMTGDGIPMDLGLRARLFDTARTWRGVRIPWEAHKAADFIWWLLTSGMLAQMMAGGQTRAGRGGNAELQGSSSVDEFWDLATSA
ncbi:MAG: hypothetical protein WBM17_14430 [Anaerolineales bacterium]